MSAAQSDDWRRGSPMWYCSWIPGLGLAVVFGVFNAMWYEISEGDDEHGFGPEAQED